MSEKFVTNLDLNKNQLENVVIHNLSVAPSNPAVGQQYYNTTNNKLYIWTGTEWDNLSDVADLSAYRTAADQDIIDATKQPTLVSGTNIKTVNGNSLLGSGNVDINGLPTQTGQSGKFLTTDGTDASWGNPVAVIIREW